MSWLKTARVKVLEGWPAKSPDLNPIEQIWADINRRVSNYRKQADSLETLKKYVEDEWNAIPLSTINNYVLSFKNKAARCRKNGGGRSEV